MKLNEMLESKYMKQADVSDEEVVTVETLKKVNVARDDEDPDYRWTVKFQEHKKSMVVNATNLKRMFKFLGDDSDEWPGKKIVLYVDPNIEFGGNIVGGLRLKAAARPSTKVPVASDDVINRKLNRAAADDLDSEIPF